MKLKNLFYGLLFVLWALAGAFVPSIIRAQMDISGVINQYARVDSIDYCANKARVTANAAAFSSGDLALLIQMKGAEADTVSTLADTFGVVRNYNMLGQSGYCEFVTIKQRIGNFIFFNERLGNTYLPKTGPIQLVSVPRYGSARVIAPLMPAPWNGATGGVLALDVAGVLTLEANIDGNGRGFRGGAASATTAAACNASDVVYAAGLGVAGLRGEGIDAYTPTAGRGAVGNAGGGGSGPSASGGGGSNPSNGGKGGATIDTCATNDYGGRGGHPIPYSAGVSRVFMGGGGGGGQSRIATGGAGGAGGAIIIIRAATLINNGTFTIASNGAPGNNAGRDGSGGGGGGGSVVLQIQNYASPVKVFARGGNGGNSNITPAYGCNGAGGGGGGGFLGLSQTIIPANFQFDLKGGARGAYLTNQFCNPVDFNMTDGQQGVWVGGYTVGQGTTTFSTVGLSAKPYKACIESGVGKIVVTPIGGFPSYEYSANAGSWQKDTVLNNLPAGVYIVHIRDKYGCKHDTTVQILLSDFKVNIGVDSLIVCGPITLSADVPAEKYLWSTGDSTPSITIDKGGKYWQTIWLRATDEFDCDATDTMRLWRFRAELGPPDTIGCDKLVLDADSGGIAYQWSNGDFYRKITVRRSGTYKVRVQAPSGCYVTDEINVSIYPSPDPDFSSDFQYCPLSQDGITIKGPAGYSEYLWTRVDSLAEGDTLDVDSVRIDSVFIPRNSHYSKRKYKLKVSDAVGCTAERLFTLTPFCGTGVLVPTVFSPNGDHQNDEFFVVADPDSIETYKIEVFDRMGTMVYTSQDFLQKWNGKRFNTEGWVPEGAYMYFLTYKRRSYNILFQAAGSITVIR